MIAPIDLVLFDLGNTLFYDNAAAWPKVYARAEAALWRVLRAAGVTVSPADLYGGHPTLLSHYYALRGDGILEPGTFQVLRELVHLHSPGIADATLTHALRAMYRVTQTNWKVEREARPVLRALQKRSLRIGAISNGSYDWNALELLDRAGLRRYFELVVTSGAHGRRKPDPSIFRAALGHFHVEPGRAVMIGDSYEADMLGASALGIRTIWVTRRVDVAAVPMTIAPDATLPGLRGLPACLG